MRAGCQEDAIYDEGADVFYIGFQKPQRADESEMKDNNIIILSITIKAKIWLELP